MQSSFDNLVHSNRKGDFQACKYKAECDVTVSNKVSHHIFQNNFEEILVHVLHFWVLRPCSSFTYHGDEPPAQDDDARQSSTQLKFSIH